MSSRQSRRLVCDARARAESTCRSSSERHTPDVHTHTHALTRHIRVTDAPAVHEPYYKLHLSWRTQNAYGQIASANSAPYKKNPFRPQRSSRARNAQIFLLSPVSISGGGGGGRPSDRPSVRPSGRRTSPKVIKYFQNCTKHQAQIASAPGWPMAATAAAATARQRAK